jgi:DNA-binding transcriptional LysR family regulator
LHVLPIVSDFLKAYPDINIRLVLADLLVHLLEDGIDLAVRIGPLPDSSLIASRVGLIRRVVCASPAYLARRGTPSVATDLTEHDCVTVERLASPSAWSFTNGKIESIVPVQSRLVVNTAEAAIDAAVSGLGVTRVLSYQVAQAVQTGALKIVLRDFEPPAWPVNLVYAGQVMLPVKLRAFLDFAAPRLKEKLATSAMPK